MERHSHQTELNFTRCKKSKGLDADCGIEMFWVVVGYQDKVVIQRLNKN